MKIFFLIFFLIEAIAQANTISVINSTSGQVSITLQTTKQTTTHAVFPNENQYLNDINNPKPIPTIISYDNNSIEKLIITRLSTNMPQIIYYDDTNITEHNKNNGIYNLNTTRFGTIQIWPGYIGINRSYYTINDLSSYVTRSNQLRNLLSPTNLDATQKQVEDLVSSIKIIKNSDMAYELESQIKIVESGINILLKNIEIMKTLNQKLKSIEDLQKNLSKSNLSQTKESLHKLQSELRNLSESNLKGSVYNQVQALENAMNALQGSIDQLK